MVDTEVAAVLEALLTRRHKAATIAKRVAIGAHVVDALVIEATPDAAAWYGWETPTQLIGSWISLLHHPDDARLGRVLSTARHHGIHVPNAYVSRIRQAHTATFRAVMKHTTQIHVGSETYWITVLSEAKEAPLALQTHQYASLLPVPEDAAKFCGTMSVADMEATLIALGHTSVPSEILSEGTLRPAEKTRVFSPPLEAQCHRVLDIALGETVVLAPGLYIHRCARCAGLWTSSQAHPARCGKRPCQQYAWRELADRFRLLADHGDAITPEMIRAQKRRRMSRTQP